MPSRCKKIIRLSCCCFWRSRRTYNNGSTAGPKVELGGPGSAFGAFNRVQPARSQSNAAEEPRLGGVARPPHPPTPNA